MLHDQRHKRQDAFDEVVIRHTGIVVVTLSSEDKPALFSPLLAFLLFVNASFGHSMQNLVGFTDYLIGATITNAKHLYILFPQ